MASHLKFDGLLTDWLFPPKRSPIRSAPDHLLFTNSPPSDSEAQEAQGIIADEKQRLHLLDEKIVYIQRKLLVPLLQQRDEARQRIDQQACVLAPVRRMPSEILCDIFYLTLLSAELSYGSFETSESPWVLTHVCRHWRNIAISFPSLWNTIILRRVRCPLNMLQAQIKRAGNVLLEVRTSYLLEDVVGALAACSPRWGIVHCLPSLLSAISGRVPMLRELHLQGNVGSHEDQNLEDAPALREVSLRGFSVGFSPSLLPWAQLTHYRCEYGTWEEHIPALDLMRNLVQCQLCVVGLRYAHPHPIELPLLRDFKLDTVVAIPDCLVLPSLEDLFIIRQLDGLISMVRRSQCRLKKITLPVHLTTDSIVALFQESPTAVDITMTIRGDQMLIMDNLNRLFDKLSIISSSTECLLPDLERVTIVTSTPLLGFQGSFVGMLRSRLRTNEQDVRRLQSVSVLANPSRRGTPLVDETLQSVLRGFQKDGLHVTIEA